MCGIAGIISNDPETRIGSALKSIEHRGRDDEGVFVSTPFGINQQKICLGHRRLSIIDTSSAGHQPMFTDDKRFSVVLNGEIYNYKQIRSELESNGEVFTTNSDTEVLLKAFRKWNVGCLDRLNGMFAFAVWDDVEKELTLARDRAGIKPLYYAKIGNDLIFASEIKAILATKLIRAELDLEGLDQYLTFLWTPDPQTTFKNIFKLPPAHYLKWKNGEIIQTEWWDLSFDEIDRHKSEGEWREELLETLGRVVDMEMLSDVPLGAFLSGGVDSSVIVGLMNQNDSSRKVSTYTVGIEKEDLHYDIIPDDTVWARRVGQIFDTDYHEFMLKPNVAELLPMLVRHLDEPVADPAVITSYLVSKAARETLTVLLSGVGGDELFAGYPRHLAMRLASAFDPIPQRIRQPIFKSLESTLPGGLPGKFTAPLRNAKKFAKSGGMDFEDRYLGFGTYFTAEAKQMLYTENNREKTNGLDPYKYHRRYFERVKNADPLNRLLYVDFKTFLPCLNLAYTDKTSMAANLEVRVPFLNVELIELAARMPVNLKLKGLKRKYILKRAAEKLLPHDIVWRKKAGFGAPIRSWLRGPLQPMVNELLSESTIKNRGLFDPMEVKRIVSANLSGKQDFSLQVFQLLTLELWMQEFLD
ncbi:MAG: asparagine synthase (glutamine-hydrolyzing) [Chloracidobacterium sp.]|nr:asparagine synthase (glutamine-hydrolyzing) [Chloracidobacterium sp.]